MFVPGTVPLFEQRHLLNRTRDKDWRISEDVDVWSRVVSPVLEPFVVQVVVWVFAKQQLTKAERRWEDLNSSSSFFRGGGGIERKRRREEKWVRPTSHSISSASANAQTKCLCIENSAAASPRSSTIIEVCNLLLNGARRTNQLLRWGLSPAPPVSLVARCEWSVKVYLPT